MAQNGGASLTEKAVCVFSSSSDDIQPHFFKAAEELGLRIAQRNCTLVYGGGNIGLMGALARAVHRHHGRVVGVIPELLRMKGYAYEGSDELVVTKDMRDRKTVMERRSQAFIGMAGGFGTLEEIVEILTLKQLKYHAKPIVLLNTHGFYDPLVEFFEHLYKGGFAKAKHRELYHVAKTVDDALAYLDDYPAPADPLTRPL